MSCLTESKTYRCGICRKTNASWCSISFSFSDAFFGCLFPSFNLLIAVRWVRHLALLHLLRHALLELCKAQAILAVHMFDIRKHKHTKQITSFHQWKFYSCNFVTVFPTYQSGHSLFWYVSVSPIAIAALTRIVAEQLRKCFKLTTVLTPYALINRYNML